MHQNVLKRQPYQNGFTDEKAYSPEMGEWQVWKKLSEQFIVMYRQQNGSIVFAPLYIHSFSFVIPKNRANICKFGEKYPNPEMIDHTGIKIRYYRYQKDLLDEYNLFLYQGQAVRLKKFRKENNLTQKQLGKFLGVDVTKIKGWEQNRVRMSKASYNKFASFEKSFCNNR